MNTPDPMLAQAAALMRHSWARPCWAFTPELLAEYVARPSGDPELCIACERDGELVGWFAGVPTGFLHAGGRRRAVFTTFLTVDRDRAGAQVALQLVRELVHRARAKGFTHAYTVFFAGTGSVPAVRRMFELCRAPMRTLMAFRFWIGAPRMIAPRLAAEPAEPEGVRELGGQDAAELLAALERLATHVPLVQCYTEGDLRAVLGSSRCFAIWRDGAIQGCVLAREREVLRPQPGRNLHLEWLGFMSGGRSLLRGFVVAVLRQLLHPEIDAVVVPGLGFGGGEDVGLEGLGFLRLGERCEVACAELGEGGGGRPEGRIEAAVMEVY